LLCSFAVENFRCLSDTKLNDLKRVNLITGINNVGKTSLLESLFIFSGTYNPELLLRVNKFRGYSGFDINFDSSASPPWESLFREFNTNRMIRVCGLFKNNGERIITISHSLENVATPVKMVPVKHEEGTYASSSMPILSATMTVKEIGEKKQVFRIVFDPNGMRIEPTPPPPPFPGVFIAASSRFDFKEEARRFSSLVNKKQEGIVIEALRRIDSRVKDVSLTYMAGEPVLNADIGISHLIPLPDMGEGITRLLRVVLAISSSPEGIVMIDEIENGFHYSCLGDLWEVIDEVSRNTNTQVFITTHSLECIKSAHEVFGKGDYDFALFRLDRIKEEIEIMRYDKETLTSSLEFGMDVR